MSARRSSWRCWLGRRRRRTPRRILEKRGQSHDHPILLNVPETAYLKCIICQAM